MQQLKSLSCLASAFPCWHGLDEMCCDSFSTTGCLLDVKPYLETIVCILLPLFGHGDPDKCSIRQQLHQSFTDKLRVHCDVNDICTAVHCQGIFLTNVVSSEMKTKQNDTMCFGTIINHCDVPLSMDVYLQYNAMNYSLMKRLYNNISVPLYNHVFLYIELSHKDVVDNLVTIKVLLKFGTLGQSLPYTLVPERTYKLPSCPASAKRTKTPQPPLKECHPPPVTPNTGQSEEHHNQHHNEEVTVQNTTQQYIQSVTYGKPCNPKELYSCHSKEICTFQNVCKCQPGLLIYPITGFCDVPGAKHGNLLSSVSPKPAIDQPIPQPLNISAHPLVANIDSVTVKNSAIITGLSVGAAVLLGTIILVAFIIWKRQKNQNSHVPLIDNEEVVI